MPVIIEIKNLQTKVPLPTPPLIKAIRKAVKRAGVTSGRLSFIFLDDRRIRAINRQFLHHDYATDVITFDESELKQKKPIRHLEGEILVSVQTAARQAKEFQTSLSQEILLYMIHGVLHLLGYDDHGAAAIKKMRTMEQQWLAAAGELGT